MIGFHHVNADLDTPISFMKSLNKPETDTSFLDRGYGKNSNFVDSDLPIGFTFLNPEATIHYYAVALKPTVVSPTGKLAFCILFEYLSNEYVCSNECL